MHERTQRPLPPPSSLRAKQRNTRLVVKRQTRLGEGNRYALSGQLPYSLSELRIFRDVLEVELPGEDH